MSKQRTDIDIWAEILQARRRHHLAHREQDGMSRETWRADEQIKWRPALSLARGLLDDSLVPGSDLDPRTQLIELAAVAVAWVAAMDLRPGVAS